MKKTLLTLVALFCTTCAWADGVIDGINYYWDTSTKTATVTSKTPKYEGDIVIPSTVEINGETYNVTAIRYSAFNKCEDLTSIVIPESITSIGSTAFQNCQSLKEVTIPEGITTIETQTFYNCTSLERVTFPSTLVTIEDWTFYNCQNLTEAILPEGLTSISSYAFYCCSSLSDINIPSTVSTIDKHSFEGVNAAKIEMGISTPPSYVFGENNVFIVPDGAGAAYKAAWPDQATQVIEKSTQIDFVVDAEARNNSSDVMDKICCELGLFAIEDAAMLNVVTLKVTGTINSYDVMAMRNKMTNLRELDLSNASIVANGYEYYSGYHTEDNVLGGYMFYNKKTLRKIVLPKDITSIGIYAFYECSSLIEITIPENVTEIKYNAFEGCI